MKILENILIEKHKEVAELKSLYPIKLLERTIYFNSQPVSLRQYLQRPDKVGIIAEIKRKSPGAGELQSSINIEEVSIGYMQAGASALSVLTDKSFFGGSKQDLTMARTFNFCPILRKEFIIDPYQIVESKSIGADVVLLIAAILTPHEVRNFTILAHELKMEVLLELHGVDEFQKYYTPEIDIVGVNNRDLDTLLVDVNTSFQFIDNIPNDILTISESGINSPPTVANLKAAGFNGFLIGEHFMKQSEPHLACREFIHEVNRLIQQTQS